MSWQAFFLAVWKWHFPACVVHGRADPLLLFHFSAPYPLQSLSAFFLPLASVERREEATALFHIFWPLNSPPDVVLPFSYIRGRFVYCPFLLVRFNDQSRRFAADLPQISVCNRFHAVPSSPAVSAIWRSYRFPSSQAPIPMPGPAVRSAG